MATFGRTGAGTDGQFPAADGRAFVTLFTLTEAGDVTKLTATFAAASTAGSSAKPIILAVSAGEPGAVVATGAGVAVPAGGGALDLPITASLAAGDYYLGVVWNSFQSYIAQQSVGTTPSRMANGTFSYSSPPGTWPGTDASYSAEALVYATYTPSGGGGPTTPRTLASMGCGR